MFQLLVVTTLGMWGCISAGHLPACLCVLGVGTDEAASTRQWNDRDVMFAGRALDIDALPTDSSTAYRVRFIVELAWRGLSSDTVTLMVGTNSPCASYFAGARYFVVADRNPLAGAPLTTAPCDYAWGSQYPRTREMLAELGAPSWTPRPFGSRPVDSGVTRVGESAPPDSVMVHIGLGFDDRSNVARVLIANQNRIVEPSSLPAFALSEGLYQVRVIWTDGVTTDTYISVRCEERIAQIGCYAFRYLTDLRVTLPSAG